MLDISNITLNQLADQLLARFEPAPIATAYVLRPPFAQASQLASLDEQLQGVHSEAILYLQTTQNGRTSYHACVVDQDGSQEITRERYWAAQAGQVPHWYSLDADLAEAALGERISGKVEVGFTHNLKGEVVEMHLRSVKQVSTWLGRIIQQFEQNPQPKEVRELLAVFNFVLRRGMHNHGRKLQN